MRGLGRVRSHRGLVDGAGEAAGDSGGGFLSEIYAAGLTDDPDVHNLMAGSYWETDYSEADGRVIYAPIPSVRPEGAADYGRAPITTRRYPEAGWAAHHHILEAHFASSIFGGTSRLHRHVNDLTTDTLNILLDDVSFGGYGIGGAVVTRQLWRAAVGTGGGSSEMIHLSDGMLYQDVTGTNSPATLRARQDGLHNPSLTHLGTEVSWLVAGWSSSLHLQPEMTSIRSVLDARNSGSGAVEAHWDMYASTEADGPVRSLSVYADGVEVVGELTQMGGPVAATGITGAIDFLATGTYTISLPTRPGKLAMASLSRFVVEARTGIATGNLTYKVGNNGGHDNLIAAGTTAAAAGFNSAPNPGTVGGASAGGMPDMTSDQLVIEVTGALGGASVLSGYFLLSIWYVDP